MTSPTAKKKERRDIAMSTITIVVLTLLCTGIFGLAYYVQCIWKPRNAKEYFDDNPDKLLTWQYEGGLRQMRKLKVSLETKRVPLLEIGFVYN